MRRRQHGALLTDLVFATLLFGVGVRIWLSVDSTAERFSRMVSSDSRATSLLQPRAKQLWVAGSGRLTFTGLRNANIVDVSPNIPPHRLETVNGLTSLPSPRSRRAKCASACAAHT